MAATPVVSSSEDFEDDAPILVVDTSGRSWQIGRAGDDAPDILTELEDSPGGNSVLAPSAGLWETRRRKQWDLLEEDYMPDYCPRESPTDALFTVSIFDDIRNCDEEYCRNGRDIVATIFSEESERRDLRVGRIGFVLQELMVLYACGTTTALIVYLADEYVTVVGFYWGVLLGETARRAPIRASEADFVASPAEWERKVMLAALVAEAIRSAPLDIKGVLMDNIVIGHKGAHGWHGLGEHLNAELAEHMRPESQKHRVKVVMPPEARFSCWIGASIFASIETNQHVSRMLTAEILRAPAAGGLEQARSVALLPGNHAEWEAQKLHYARALLLRVPHLFQKFPVDILDKVCDWLKMGIDWPEVPSLRSVWYLPPDESALLTPQDGYMAIGEAGGQSLLHARSESEAAVLHTAWAPVAAQLCDGRLTRHFAL
jgi:hypothetical protein